MATEQTREPFLADEPPRIAAEDLVRLLVYWVGPGFHPDTDFNQYVTASTGGRSFPPVQADRLNAKLEQAITVLSVGGQDVYDIAAPVQHALLGPCFSKASLAR